MESPQNNGMGDWNINYQNSQSHCQNIYSYMEVLEEEKVKTKAVNTLKVL